MLREMWTVEADVGLEGKKDQEESDFWSWNILANNLR